APEHASLFEAMQALWETSTSDPRMTELNAEWADCMADAGYADYATPDDAVNAIMEASNALWENIEYDEESEEAPAGPSVEAMAEVGKSAWATARADFTCKEETGCTESAKKVQFELEEQFIKDHKAELDTFVAAVEKAEAE